jgi:hypothetical protein
VIKLLESAFIVEDFKGYNNVLLSHHNLKVIVNRSEESWRSALSSVGGVYIIMDKQTGKAYVGSAYGQGGIWQRWCCYADNGHGGNAELIALLTKEGGAYAEHFQYAILEIADPLDTMEQVCIRESHWKRVLMSREFGYCAN